MPQEQPFEKVEIYQIRIKGILDEKWSDWFDGFTIKHESQNETILEGPVPDQGALHGLLARLRDLGLPIRSIVSLSQEENQAMK